jgi:parallel beta-helix repeat protein
VIAENFGAGVSCFSAAPILSNCTISGNSSWGVYVNWSAPILRNCVVWGNGRVSIYGGGDAVPRCSFNCMDTTGDWGPFFDCPGDGNVVNQDPLFVRQGRYDDNGTPDDRTDDKQIPGDYHLRAGSPCTDTGTCDDAPLLDLDGHVRPAGIGCDMGAHELNGSAPPPPPFHRGDPNSSGTTDLSDAITIFSHLFLGEPATLSCLESADANNDAAIDLSDGIYLLGWLFSGGPAPVAPGPSGEACGLDPDPPGSRGDLGCNGYAPCR